MQRKKKEKPDEADRFTIPDEVAPYPRIGNEVAVGLPTASGKNIVFVGAHILDVVGVNPLTYKLSMDGHKVEQPITAIHDRSIIGQMI